MRTYGSDSHVTPLLKILATGLTSFAKLVSERTFSFFFLLLSTVEHLQPQFNTTQFLTLPYVERILNEWTFVDCAERKHSKCTGLQQDLTLTEATKLICTPHIDAVCSQTVPLYLRSIKPGHSNGGVVSGFPSTIHLACRGKQHCYMNSICHCGMNRVYACILTSNL